MIWAKVVHITTRSVIIIISGANKSSIKLGGLIQETHSLDVFFDSVMVGNDEYMLTGVLDTISRTTIASENAPKGLGHMLVP